MREKLQKLMQDQGLTSSKLAEILEIQPSGISHLMAGRNKPGFDLIQRILRRFPQINPDWLLLDSGQMYRDQYKMQTPPSESTLTETTQLVSNTNPHRLTDTPPQELFASTTASNHLHIAHVTGNPAGASQSESSRPDATEAHLQPNTSSASRIERVVIFYDDHTFESFEARRDK